MTDFGEEVEAETRLDTSSASSPLSSIAFGYKGVDQSANLTSLVEARNASRLQHERAKACVPHLFLPAGVDNTGDVRNSDTCLGDIGS